MKIISFNVNGVRAIMKKNFKADMQELNPDILCLQETKAQDDQVQEALKDDFSDYYIYSNSAVKKRLFRYGNFIQKETFKRFYRYWNRRARPRGESYRC